MHHFTKQLKKKLWYHLLLPVSSAVVTVAVLDIIACCSWLSKDYRKIDYFTQDNVQGIQKNLLDILYWIFVTYRVILSLLLCVGGIFMGRKLVVITWLSISLLVDLIHLAETIFVISKPHLVPTWPLFIAVASSIWGEIKIIRIKYRIIRRTFQIDWNNTELLQTNHCSCNFDDSFVCKKCETEINSSIQDEDDERTENSFELGNIKKGFCLKSNIINFIKLARNLYNLLTWHLTGFLFGGDFHKLLSKNYKAVFLEEKFIRYARIFLDALTIVYILQEKKLFLTPWITLYILFGSVVVALFLLILLHLNLMTYLLLTIYYLVFSIDLFFRLGFLFYCVKLVVKRKELI